MRKPLLIGALLAAGTLLAEAANASIFIEGQHRHVATSAFVTSEIDFDSEDVQLSAPDNGPFEVSFVAQAEIDAGNAIASGSQISVIAPTFIRAEGVASGVAQTFDAAATAYGIASSNIAIRFMLTQSANFTITGFLEAESAGGVSLQLSRPFQTVAWYNANENHIDVDHAGVLDADTYDINITCTGNGQAFEVGDPEHGLASYEIIFALGAATDAPVIAAPASAVLAAPNPFRDTVRLTLPDGALAAQVYDARGRVVRTLTTSQAVSYDGRDDAGRSLASGVYWVKPVGIEGAEGVKLVRVR